MDRLPLPPIVALVIMALAWLMPNHYLPWLSFHSEVTSAAGFALLSFAALVRAPAQVHWPRLAVLALALAGVPLAQAWGGLVFFWGDAWIASLYLVGFALAIVTGYRLLQVHDPQAVLATFWLSILSAAILSVGIALCQWLGVPLGLLATDMRPGGQPFANLAQPNHLATLLALGVVATFALAQQGRVGRVGLSVTCVYLLVGMAVTVSRTAWLQVGVLAIWMLVIHARARLTVPRRFALALPIGLLAAVVSWQSLPGAAEGLRTVEGQAKAGTRPIHWASMLDAISREPLTGYGWNQVSVAQARVANDHAGSTEMIEHSHNTLLDLLIWNGVPIGLLVIVTTAWWLLRQVRACRQPDTAMLLAAIGVVLTHAMLEFPLEYAYFLLPLGLMMGMTQALTMTGSTLQVPRWVALVPAITALTLVLWTTREYVDLEEASRLSRFEAAGIRGAQPVPPPDPPVLLSQQWAFMAFTRQLARPGMTPDELEAMRRIALRYGYPPVLLRYALAAALNGLPTEAGDTLLRLCKIHPAIRCEEGEAAWQAAAEHQYPQLRETPFPSVPKAPAAPR